MEDEAHSMGTGCSPQCQVLALGAAGYNSLAMACRKSPFLHSEPVFEASYVPDDLAAASDPLPLFLLRPLRRRGGGSEYLHPTKRGCRSHWGVMLLL